MGRRPNRSTPSTRRRRRGRAFEKAAMEMAWDVRLACDAEAGAEPESLAELLALEYGVEPTEVEDTELFESFMDALEAEVWQDPSLWRVLN